MYFLMPLSLSTTSDIQNYFLGLFVVTAVVLLVTLVQAMRHRIRRVQRRARRLNTPSKRSQRREQVIEEYLDHAKFSNEGNPNSGWQNLFHDWNAHSPL